MTTLRNVNCKMEKAFVAEVDNVRGDIPRSELIRIGLERVLNDLKKSKNPVSENKNPQPAN